ncbi:hypothetical protein G9A89_005624 [Geosiphon pyriformis]|nr:hypothetical protein G9A89_005624 [Geosiphon pyriformis]
MDNRSRTSSPIVPEPLNEEALYIKLLQNAKKFDKIEDEGVEIARKVTHIHQEVRTMGAITPERVSELLALYQRGMDQARREEEQAIIVAQEADQLINLKTNSAIVKSETSNKQKESLGATTLSAPTKTSIKSTKKSTALAFTTKQKTAIKKVNASASNSRSGTKRSGISSPLINDLVGQLKKRKTKEEDKVAITVPGKSHKIKKSGLLSLPKGCSVAAKEPKSRSKEENYIIAIVKGYNHELKQYEVEDADETATERIFSVPYKNVIPIPKEEQVNHEFPETSTVLAIYPGTTTFYKARVVLPPSKTTDRPNKYECGKYLLEFEDDNNEFRAVEIIHVLEFPKNFQ